MLILFRRKNDKEAFQDLRPMCLAPLELVHIDLYGLINVPARRGYEYFITFIDDYSRYGYIYLMHHKSESFDKFKEFKAEVEK